MSFKINISEKGKTYKLETDSEFLIGKKIGESFDGGELNADLDGFEIKISGTSDKAGFAGKPDEEGPQLRKVLLTKGRFMKKTAHKGLRRKKNLRGNEISSATVQVNCIVVKGSKPLSEVFKKEEKVEEAPVAA